MKLILGAVIATSLILFIGILVISPVFFPKENKAQVMLSFNILDDTNLPNWCNELSNFLNSQNIKGTIFITGRLSEKYPSCVTSFPKSFDVGSQTYDYVDLTEISDYSKQLEQVQKGKVAVDKSGNLDSKIFKAPFGKTDKNIYSLLGSNDIRADFSYENQYNKYYDSKFLKFDILTYDSKYHSAESLKNIESSDKPIQIEFDNSMSVEDIKKYLEVMHGWKIKFVTASEMTNMKLTIRN